MEIDGARPRLRPLELKWVDEGGRRILFMRDPAGIAPHPATVPSWVALLLSLCDGSRNVAGLRAAFELQSGQPITLDRIQDVLRQLDDALFLDSPHYQQAKTALIREYRDAAFRPPALRDQVYPADPAALRAALAGYLEDGFTSALNGAVRGVVSPHIDYQRGGPVYAQTWHGATEAARGADLAIVFGTDHAGGLGKITLTRQNYATPLGVVPTATDVVDAIASAIGEEDAFEEELHHRREHSIELATVWLHLAAEGRPIEIVPILCGSFHHFTEGEADPASDDRFGRTIEALRQATDGRRVLAVAAADLAHVGPAFGDSRGLDEGDRQDLADKDGELLEAICTGDPHGFFGQLRDERDRRRICGLPPVYLTLRYLEMSRGCVVDYDQCPADPAGGSLVSIAGVLLQ
jgi:AmmeMemoRadiSam system protein B